MDYEIVGAEPAIVQERLQEKVAEKVAAGLENEGLKLAHLKQILRLDTRERENKRAMRGRVAKRRRKNKLEKASRKANR